MKTESPIKRRKSRQIHVGKVAVGGDAPISVQSMTNTETCDVDATVAQVQAIQPPSGRGNQGCSHVMMSRSIPLPYAYFQGRKKAVLFIIYHHRLVSIIFAALVVIHY